MPSCHESPSFAPRAFIITPYYASDEGAFAAVLPDRCLDTAACAGCEISVHHLRARRTGPQFPLTVVHCKTHGHAFTLYPPGHVPYGRVAVARNDVVQVQILPVKHAPAILAGVLVPLKNVVARELYLLLGQPVVNKQQNRSRHADAEGNGADGF